MKFAQQLENERKQEWQRYYLDYKVGKKLINQYAEASALGAAAQARAIDNFFADQLGKVETFYAREEQAAVNRILEVKMQLNMYLEGNLFPQGRAERGWARRDYSRPPDFPRTARRMLKKALVEYYRTLELLKSYIQMNQTAFRKLNKKYDKATGTHDTLRFYNRRVREAHFINSTTLAELTTEVVDLFSRHSGLGDRRAAREELRSRIAPSESLNESHRYGTCAASARGGFALVATSGEHDADCC